jgi:hypothetical protein
MSRRAGQRPRSTADQVLRFNLVLGIEQPTILEPEFARHLFRYIARHYLGACLNAVSVKSPTAGSCGQALETFETVNNVLSQRAGSVIRITARQRGNNQPVLDA